MVNKAFKKFIQKMNIILINFNIKMMIKNYLKINKEKEITNEKIEKQIK